ncbi:hypothetical protein [Marinimicrobium locisalis]|uniref:hypothetical protein n=1 Tax=Marinimicrobium locisalis TaxID=546022 RepID=UPI0032221EAD
MPLTIGVTPFAQWTCLKNLLEHLGWRSSEGTPGTAHDLTNSDPTGPWLLLHTRPEYAVAHAIDEGHTPESALQQWQTEADQLLKFFRAHRARTAMVDARAAAAHPAELVEWLAQNHSAFFELAQHYVGTVESPARPSELSLLLATQLVAQTPALTPLLTHLEAASIPLGDQHYHAPSLDIYSANEQLNSAISAPRSKQETLRRQLEEHQKRLTELQTARAHTEEALKSENDLLIAQLHKVQEELEAYYHKHRDGSKTNEELNAIITEREAEVARLRNELTKAKQGTQADSESLEAEVSRLREALSEEQKRNETDGHSVDAEAKRLRETLSSVEQEVAAQKRARESSEVETSRLNKELQQVINAKSRAEARESDLKEENDLILKQLFQVQEELENYFLDLKDKEKQLQEREAELHKLRESHWEELEKSRATHKEIIAEKDKLNKKLVKLEAEHGHLKKEKRLLSASLSQVTAQREGFTLKRLAAPIKNFTRTSRELRHGAELIRASELFDEAWYLQQNPDVSAQSIEPALHYVKYGGAEGRAASPQFDSASYLEKNPDVAEQGLNPLVHYLLHGKSEGREL